MKTEGAILPGEKPVDPVEVLLDLIRENHALKERVRTDRFPLSAIQQAYMDGAEEAVETLASDTSYLSGRINKFWRLLERSADAYVKLVVSQREES